MEDEAVGRLVAGGGGELELPSIGTSFFPRDDEFAGAEGSLISASVTGLVEEAAGVHDSPVRIPEVQEDGRIPKIALGGRPVGIFHHSAPEKSPRGEGLSGRKIIALGFASGSTAKREGSNPVA